MKPRLVRFTLLFTVLLFSVSCGKLPPVSKKAYIRNFTSFINDVENNHSKYTQEDWEKADLKFSKFAELYFDKFKSKLTDEETRKVNLLKGKYLGIKIKGKSKKVIEEIFSTFENTLDEAEGVIETLMQNTTEYP